MFVLVFVCFPFDSRITHAARDRWQTLNNIVHCALHSLHAQLRSLLALHCGRWQLWGRGSFHTVCISLNFQSVYIHRFGFKIHRCICNSYPIWDPQSICTQSVYHHQVVASDGVNDLDVHDWTDNNSFLCLVRGTYRYISATLLNVQHVCLCCS